MDQEKFNEMLDMLGEQLLKLFRKAEKDGKSIDVEMKAFENGLIAKWELKDG